MTFAQPFTDYEVLERVGAGSMGTVFKARHKKLNRIVALKVLKPSLARDARYVDRLRREARIVASLNHPNIVTGYDLGQEGGYHFFVMEFVEGKSLRELLNEWGMFAEERVLDVAIQITTALDHAFQKGVIHRDIKPANVLIDEENVVKLTDMGLAKGPDNLTITRDGATVGTPQYISPEQAQSPQDVDVRSDLYSLGATLFHMCTGQPPFRAETMANVLVKVLNERAPSAAGVNPDLSDGLNLIIRKLLSKDPDRRYQTPAELLDDLARVRRSELPAVVIEDLDTGEEPESKKWVWYGGAAVAVLLLGLGLFWFTRDNGTGKPVPPDEATKYAAEVDAELDAIERLGDRLKRLQQRESRATEAFQKSVLAARRKQDEETLRIELRELFSGARQRRDAIHSELSWADPEGDLDAVADNLLKERFGLVAVNIPPDVRPEFDTCRAWLREGLPQFLEGRYDNYRKQLQRYVGQLHADQQEALRDNDFAEAERQLAADLDGFDAIPGTPPGKLPAVLQKELTAAREQAATAAQARLSTKEKELAAALSRAVKSDLARIEKIASPAAAEAELERVREDLEGDYPPARFRAAADPWVQARTQLSRAASVLAQKRREAERTQVDAALRMAYESLAAGRDVDQVREVLDWQTKALRKHQGGRVDAHLALLADAAQLRRRLLEALLGGKSSRAIKLPGRREFVVTRTKDRLQLRQNGEALHLAQLNLGDLCLFLGGDAFLSKLNGAEREALAFWYVASGDRAVKTAYVGAARAKLFGEDIIPLNLEPTAPPGEVAHRLFESIRKAIAANEWGQASKSLDSLEQAHPQYAAKHQQYIALARQQVKTGNAKSVLVARVQKRALPGAVVTAPTTTVARVEIDFAEKGVAVPELDRVGWQHRTGSPIRYASHGTEFDQLPKRRLVVPTGLAPEVRLDGEVEVVFEEEVVEPRVAFFTCHGVTFAVGLHRDGTLTAVVLEKGLESARPAALRTAFGKALARAGETRAVVVPGARHRVGFTLRPRKGARRQWSMGIRFDGVEVAAATVTRSKPTGTLAVASFEPLTVHRARFEGDAAQ